MLIIFMIYNDLTKIRNAYAAKHEQVILPYSKLTFNVIKVISKKGYTGEVKKDKDKNSNKEYIKVNLKYNDGVPFIHLLKIISKPGQRIYTQYSDLRKYRQGFGDIIISTSKGIMTGEEAQKNKLGGEIICEVF